MFTVCRESDYERLPAPATQARAIWAGVGSSPSPTGQEVGRNGWLARRFSGVQRGKVARLSVGGVESGAGVDLARSSSPPRADPGAEADAHSWQVSSTPLRSGSRCTHASIRSDRGTGSTACARRIVAPPASESPKWQKPCPRRRVSLTAPATSSMVHVRSTRMLVSRGRSAQCAGGSVTPRPTS